jgi:hypothetical protein
LVVYTNKEIRPSYYKKKGGTMPDLRIQTAIDNGDLPKDHGRSFKALTLFDALKDTTVIKKYNEQYKKEFGRPSVFASPTKVPRSEKT